MRYLMLILLLMCFGCGKKTSTPVDHPSIFTEQQSACGDESIYAVSAHLMPANLYVVPNKCFEPRVEHADMSVQNKKRKTYLAIIGVMEERGHNETGTEMLEYCWETTWKYQHMPDHDRQSATPAVCSNNVIVTRGDLETVKGIEACRVECEEETLKRMRQ